MDVDLIAVNAGQEEGEGLHPIYKLCCKVWIASSHKFSCLLCHMSFPTEFARDLLKKMDMRATSIMIDCCRDGPDMEPLFQLWDEK